MRRTIDTPNGCHGLIVQPVVRATSASSLGSASRPRLGVPIRGTRVILTCIILFVATAVLGQDRRSEFDETYGVISERNMFLKDRPRPRAPTSRPSSTQQSDRPPEPPESTFVLRGVAIEENGFRAYLEGGSGMTRVAPGDPIARGHVVEIAIDAIAYEHDGVITWILVGQNLSGTNAASSVVASPTSQPGPTSGATSGTTANTSNLSAEERMRLRRQQERGRGN